MHAMMQNNVLHRGVGYLRQWLFKACFWGRGILPRKLQSPGNFAKYGTPKSRPTAEKLSFVDCWS